MREKTQIKHPKFSKPKEYKPRKLTQTQKFQAQTQKIKHTLLSTHIQKKLHLKTNQCLDITLKNSKTHKAIS